MSGIIHLFIQIFKNHINNMEFLNDLWGFLKVRKKYWLLPIILVLMLLGILIIFSSGSAIAPFIYTLF